MRGPLLVLKLEAIRVRGKSSGRDEYGSEYYTELRSPSVPGEFMIRTVESSVRGDQTAARGIVAEGV